MNYKAPYSAVAGYDYLRRSAILLNVSAADEDDWMFIKKITRKRT